MLKIALVAPVRSRSGYGVHSRMIANALLKFPDKYIVDILPTKWGNTPNTEFDAGIEPFVVPEINYEPDLCIQVSIPSEFRKFGKKNIGITAGTESTIAPMQFLEGCNNVDLVITPSKFTREVLLNTVFESKNSQTGQIVSQIRCTKPIEVLFEGLDTTKFNKESINRELPIYKMLNDVKEDFCFLFVGHWLDGKLGEDRKNVGKLVESFIHAFKNKGLNKRPALILKTSGAGFSHMEKDRILDKIDQIYTLVRESGFTGKIPSIYVLNGDLNDLEMNTLYNHPKVKAMVNFTKGEGWGLPMMEFSQTGKPIIVSNHSGHLDYLNPEYCVLLPGQLTPIDASAANEWLPREGQWFTVNYVFALAVLQKVYENYEKFHEKSRKLPKYVRDNFNLELMSQKLSEIIDNNVVTAQKAPIKLNLPKLTKI